MAGFMRIGRTDFEQIIRIFQKRHVPLALALWLELNYRAKWEDTPTLKKGELFCGRGELGAAIGASEQTIRTMLNQLQTNKLLTSKSTNKGTVFSIVSYWTYTIEDIETNKQTNKHINSEVTTNEEVITKKQEQRLPPTGAENGKPRDAYFEQAVELLELIVSRELTKQERAMIGRWRKLYPDEQFLLSHYRRICSSKETVNDLTTFFGKVLKTEWDARIEATKPRSIMPKRSW